MLSEQQIANVTNAYYACFCGMNPDRVTGGVHLICSESRNERLRGFGCRYTVFALMRQDVLIIAYAPQHAAFFDALSNRSSEEILTAMHQAFHLKKTQLMVFRQERVHDFGSARILQTADYPLYEAFFRESAPHADPTGWLQSYFEERAAKGYFTGCFADGALTSVCDAPDMPYMEGAIQHTGIITLPAVRRRGYARAAAALAAHHLLENDVCPQWECRADNAASIALAESVGYAKYGIAFILEE